MAAALLFAAGAATAQDFGHAMPWDDDESRAGNMAGQVFSRGNVQVGPMRIRTSRPACILNGGFPVVRALVEPSDTVASVSLSFRPEGYALWYQVPMKKSGEGFLGVMPKPRPSARTVRYYVQVIPTNGPPLRGNEVAAKVVEEPAQCGGVPAETVETAAIAVKVPKGAPAQPPVPPGFEPVGTVSLEPPRRGGGKTPLLVAGGFAGVLGALFATSNQPTLDTPADTPANSNRIEFVDSNPPPDTHLSLRAGLQLSVRLRVRLGGGLGTGLGVVTLFSSFSPGSPCAVLAAPMGQLLPGSTQEVVLAGTLQQARVCQPANAMRIEILQNGTVVAGTGNAAQPDFPARYFIDP